jgi:hypothetical protein
MDRFKPMPKSASCTRKRKSVALSTAAKQRAQARSLLPVIVERTRSALAAAGIAYEIFYLIPGGGDAIISFGTNIEPDPTDEEWSIISGIVCGIIKDALEIKKVMTREMTSAAVRPLPA